MPRIVFHTDAKTIIELAQDGTPLRVYVAPNSSGAPLVDLTNEGEELTAQEKKDGKPAGNHPKRADMAFFEGNCVWINGVKYCNP